MGAYVFPPTSGVGDGVSSADTSAKVMVNDDALFRVVGHVIIRTIVSECITNNGATASTIQYKVIPDVGSSTTISGASASLANATAGTIVVLAGAALSDAPTVAASGVALNTTARGINCADADVSINVGVGSTTGTWKHFIRYDRLQPDAYIYALQ